MTDAIISADPNYIDDAWAELKQRLTKPRLGPLLADGVRLMSFSGTFGEVGAELAAEPPIFVRHIHPVEQTVSLPAEIDDDSAVEAIGRVARQELIDAIPTSLPFSIQTRILIEGYPLRPYPLNQGLQQLVERYSGAPVDVRNPRTVLSLTLGELQSQAVAFLGVSDVQHNLSDWAGGVRRFRREKGQISRAEFKLLEAIEWFAIELPHEGLALDLGAAPGGWTRVLRQQAPGVRVVAVDPGRLNRSLRNDRGVRYVAQTAGRFLRQLGAEERFDIVLNDMRLDPQRSAETLLQFAPYLSENGFALMTIKLSPDHARAELDETLALLSRGFRLGGVRQLFHNRNEVTAYLRPL